jgi:Nitroreductase family
VKPRKLRVDSRTARSHVVRHAKEPITVASIMFMHAREQCALSSVSKRDIKIQNLTTKDAIEQRRSTRKFKSNPVPYEHILELIEAARLAPSGSNAQPWRFKIVTDEETRQKLAEAAYHQSFIAQAPVVLVCCASVKGYIEGTLSGIQDLVKVGALEERVSTRQFTMECSRFLWSFHQRQKAAQIKAKMRRTPNPPSSHVDDHLL